MDVKELVKAVREDPYLGKGSASYMDETQTDKELGELIQEIIGGMSRPVTKERVLKGLTDIENLWREQDAEIFAARSETKTAKDFPFQKLIRAK